MIRPLINADLARPRSADTRRVRGGRARLRDAGSGAFPPRPDAKLLSEAIPLFFIGRNRNGIWFAREAAGRIGGLFLFRRSALRFAAREGAAAGCATMLLNERVELDAENGGGRFAGAVNALMSRLVGSIGGLAASSRNDRHSLRLVGKRP